jgi:hypothetical protein
MNPQHDKTSTSWKSYEIFMQEKAAETAKQQKEEKKEKQKPEEQEGRFLDELCHHPRELRGKGRHATTSALPSCTAFGRFIFVPAARENW